VIFSPQGVSIVEGAGLYLKSDEAETADFELIVCKWHNVFDWRNYTTDPDFRVTIFSHEKRERHETKRFRDFRSFRGWHNLYQLQFFFSLKRTRGLLKKAQKLFYLFSFG